jgi:hypothetical protein
MQGIRTYAGVHATCETRNSFKSTESTIKENTKKKPPVISWESRE